MARKVGIGESGEEGLLTFQSNDLGMGETVQRIETDGALIFLAGGHAYKMKRDVCLPYLDFCRVEKRRLACENELRLNQRTTPSLYLGTKPVLRLPDGALAIDEGSGEEPPIEDAVDYLAAHGCRAKAVTQARGHGSIGDDLLLTAHNQGADLLVMGACSHNRIQELVFGGATLEALLDATILVLMIH